MFVNYLLFPTLALGAALYAAGHRLGGRAATPGVRRGLLGACLLPCLPGLSFIIYYLHLVQEPVWYVEFRSLPGVEMLSAFWGLPFGFLEIRSPLAGMWRYLAGNRMMLRLSLLVMFAPFAKPVLLPFLKTPFHDAWRDGVCLQSTQATCGPCSLATIYRSLGIVMSERDIARDCFSGMTGTESWYLIRHARRHGLKARLVRRSSVGEVAPPAILGITLDNGAGHFIAYLGDESRRRVIGDPLSGRFLLTDEFFRKLYKFSGAAIEFSRIRRP